MTESKNSPKINSRPVPERFLASRSTLRLDAVMGWVIRVGGVGIIIAVLGIFVFILGQVIPLFGGADVRLKTETGVVADPSKVRMIGLDDNSEVPFVYEGGDDVKFVSTKPGTGVVAEKISFPEGGVPSAISYQPSARRVIFGTTSGQVGSFQVFYDRVDGGLRGSVKVGDSFSIGVQGAPVEQVGYADSDSSKFFAAVQNQNGTRKVIAFPLTQKKSLLGAGKIVKGDETDLTSQISGSPVKLLVPHTADGVLVADDAGVVHYFFLSDGALTKRQEFKPFADTASPAIASMNFIFGDVSVVFTNADGECRIFSLLIPRGSDTRIFTHTKTFPKLEGGAAFFCTSQRNKSFLTGSGDFATLRHATTESVRWESRMPFRISAAEVDAKFKNAVFLGNDGKLRIFEINDPHPEAGWKAFFGKVWYEGSSQPKYEWQSTGGTDDFEPKLSIVPLIYGTLKGTLWAMVFSIPIALLAAIYSAQFLHTNVKRIVKPAMEIMASLPSVVLGFIAALWLAPLLERKVVSLFLVCLGIPITAMITGMIWARLPVRTRSRLRQGREWMVFIPLMLAAAVIFWKLGPFVESVFCNVTDPATGKQTADFRLWWPKISGSAFDQRNSLVVGFMMGFAVIPVIFTIAEDSISNVPGSIIAASQALGASRWQTVSRVVLPVASAGIFSAVMIGLGRAVGETMIVVMATDNTPVMEWNLFNGMRTLAANIAVELPEAPPDSTHYRTLFFGALVLFALTFVLNTVAELLRQRLRDKYKIS